MLTKEHTRPAPIATGPRRSIAIVAFAVTVVVAAAVFFVWVIADGAGPVAAGDARIELTFTGEGSSYVGDREIIEGLAEVTAINESGTEAAFVVLRRVAGSAALDQELAKAAEGGDFVTTEGPSGVVASWDVPPEAGRTTRRIALTPGTYIFDAGLAPDGGDGTHVYRIAVVEVLAD